MCKEKQISSNAVMPVRRYKDSAFRTVENKIGYMKETTSVSTTPTTQSWSERRLACCRQLLQMPCPPLTSYHRIPRQYAAEDALAHDVEHDSHIRTHCERRNGIAVRDQLKSVLSGISEI